MAGRASLVLWAVGQACPYHGLSFTLPLSGSRPDRRVSLRRCRLAGTVVNQCQVPMC